MWLGYFKSLQPVFLREQSPAFLKCLDSLRTEMFEELLSAKQAQETAFLYASLTVGGKHGKCLFPHIATWHITYSMSGNNVWMIFVPGITTGGAPGVGYLSFRQWVGGVIHTNAGIWGLAAHHSAELEASLSRNSNSDCYVQHTLLWLSLRESCELLQVSLSHSDCSRNEVDPQRDRKLS